MTSNLTTQMIYKGLNNLTGDSFGAEPQLNWDVDAWGILGTMGAEAWNEHSRQRDAKQTALDNGVNADGVPFNDPLEQEELWAAGIAASLREQERSTKEAMDATSGSIQNMWSNGGGNDVDVSLDTALAIANERSTIAATNEVAESVMNASHNGDGVSDELTEQINAKYVQSVNNIGVMKRYLEAYAKQDGNYTNNLFFKDAKEAMEKRTGLSDGQLYLRTGEDGKAFRYRTTGNGLNSDPDFTYTREDRITSIDWELDSRNNLIHQGNGQNGMFDIIANGMTPFSNLDSCDGKFTVKSINGGDWGNSITIQTNVKDENDNIITQTYSIRHIANQLPSYVIEDFNNAYANGNNNGVTYDNGTVVAYIGSTGNMSVDVMKNDDGSMYMTDPTVHGHFIISGHTSIDMPQWFANAVGYTKNTIRKQNGGIYPIR